MGEGGNRRARGERPRRARSSSSSMRGMLGRRALFGLFQPTVDNIRSAN
jgi:hypothetical protein